MRAGLDGDGAEVWRSLFILVLSYTLCMNIYCHRVDVFRYEYKCARCIFAIIFLLFYNSSSAAKGEENSGNNIYYSDFMMKHQLNLHLLQARRRSKKMRSVTHLVVGGKDVSHGFEGARDFRHGRGQQVRPHSVE